MCKTALPISTPTGSTCGLTNLTPTTNTTNTTNTTTSTTTTPPTALTPRPSQAVHRLLPPIEVLKDSQFNIDPEGYDGMDDFLKTELSRPGAVPLEQRETEIIEPPFVQVPLNVMEDRLLGSVDVEKSVQTGKTVFQPGLLAKAHRGVLYVDDLNLLDQELANILLNIITTGYVIVER